MKTMRFMLAGLLVVLMGHSTTSRAEDTDIYSGLGGAAGKPNVLIVFDNAANFSSSAAGSSCVIDGVATALSGTVGGIEQCAFYNVINALPVDVVNIGMMVYNATNIRDINNANCGGSDGGCLVVPLTTMTAANKTPLLAWIKTWVTSGGAGNGYIKASGEATAATMQEAWAYYSGGTGLSGRSYAGIKPASGCQQNFVIFIGNSYSSSGTPGDGGSASPATALSNAPGVTAAQTALITTTHVTSCGTYTFPTSSHESKGFYADEWARYMRQHDLYSDIEQTQKITTYTIGLLGSSCQAEYAATLASMANVGNGKYFATTDYDSITQALLKILNEVQATNSVFSSSSLPVSVNAQGTYLNQIYMGMFRPDSGGNPRWLGNLKQYQFIYDTATDSLKMADSLAASAINSTTGFITPNAVSFWTCANPTRSAALGAPFDTRPTCAADPTNGFWFNNPQSAGGAYDLPDGELVEKGGAAQIMRLANLTADYATAAGDSTNPRKLYTCTGACAAGNALSGFKFANSNASLTAASLGLVATKTITSLTRSGSTATATATAHGLTTGQVVQVSGAAQGEYNGSFVMTVVDANTVTYPISVSPASPATGTISANVPSSAAVAITALTRAGTTVTVTAPGNTFNPGNSVTISGVTPSAYNGNWTIICGTPPCGNTFTFTGPAEGPTTPSGNGSAAVSGYTTRTIETSTANPDPGFVRSGTTVTVKTTANHGFPDNGTVTISGASDSGYNGTYSFTKTGNRTFTYSLSSTTPTTPATALGTVSGTGTTSMSIASLTRALGAGTAATATATTSGDLTAGPFNLTVGNSYSISILGAAQSQYNGTFTAAITGATTFTYPITTSPATPATGSMILGSSVTAPDLINWVRGHDNFGDELGPGGSVTVRPSLHGDVLHSRPVVVNYGGATGVVVFYGANDGVYRAINGNQIAAIGSVPAGGELWGFIPTEFFDKLNRQRSNSPQLLMPSTPAGISPAPQRKDYFADGSTGVYQLLNADGTTNKAYLYLAMRRGGRLIYALDVTDPTNPKYLWKITNTGDFTELGQTWSAPKVASVEGYANPVLIFGAGYDTAEDSEPPATNTMGRGIFIVDAITGALVWSASPDGTTSCSVGTTPPCHSQVSGMNYSIPADITLVDRDSNGKIDRLYAVDVGGNVWRVDIQPTAGNTPDKWQVTKLAALGCDTGACASGTTPRKFFYPADMVQSTSYDAVLVGSGDREHPLYGDASYNIANRFYMLKDTNTGNNGSNLAITHSGLFDATSTAYNGALSGYYITLGTGEKVVNAPLTVAGYTYFGTNTPQQPSANSCAGLGIAKGYRVKPIAGTYTSTEFAGGGLPPSPVAGLVSVDVNGVTMLVPFIIGGGGDPGCVGADCSSALGGGKPTISVPTSRTRTYWYQEMD